MQFQKGITKKTIQTSTSSYMFQTINNNNQIEEYQTSSINSRSRSPPSNFFNRSPIRTDQTNILIDGSGYGEMLYLDPNEVNYQRTQAMSPMTETRRSGGRSPNAYQSIVSTVRNDLNERTDTANVMGRRPIPTLTMNLENKRERLSRSPKTINIGDTAQEIEYNIKTLNQGKRNPKNNNINMNNSGMINNNNNMLYQSYGNINNNEAGNIFLDQPIQQASFIQSNDQINYQTFQSNSGSFGMNSPGIPIRGNSEFLNQNSREIQYSMNPRDLQEQSPGLQGKMSPKNNVDDDSNSDIKSQQNETNNNNVMAPQTQLKDLKTQMDRNVNVMYKENDGMVEYSTNSKPIGNDLEKIEDYVKTQEIRAGMSQNELKKLVKQISKGYDPIKGKSGRLISSRQTVIPSSNEDIFNERYKVLQKMNKLSTILLAKNRGSSSDNNNLNRNTLQQDTRKTFNRNTLNSTIIGGKKNESRSPKNKFLYLSLAMLSSKGPSAEDRIILRRMRFDRGGVVDLAQESNKNKTKYGVKKVTRKGGTHTTVMINPKHREKAAKVVQGWWRGLKERYKKILDKIVLIQSVWRGRWLRKYIYDIIYLSFLHQRFCDVMEGTLVRHVRPLVWEQLFAQKKWARAGLEKLLAKNDRKFSLLRAREYLLRWRDSTNLMKERFLAGRELVYKRERNESDKMLLKKYFEKWALRSSLLKYISKSNNQEEQKNKFFGTLNLMNGLKKLTKRQSLNNSMPKLREYLKQKERKNKLTTLLNHSNRYKLGPKRKAFNKWKNIINKTKFKEIKHGIMGNMYGRILSRLDKVKMKRALDKWKRIIPRGNQLINYVQGTELLQKFCFRVTYKDPLDAILEKQTNENEIFGGKKIFGAKKRALKSSLRDYLYKWKEKTLKSKEKEKQQKLYKSLLNSLTGRIEKRILYNKFNQWRKQRKINLNEEFEKYRNLQNSLMKFAKSKIKNSRKNFWEKLKETKGKFAMKKFGGKIFEKFQNKNKSLLRKHFYKWRNQTKNSEIKNLKHKMIQFLSKSNQNKTKKNILSKYLNRWKFNTNLTKNKENINFLKNVRNAFDKLDKIQKSRKIDFIIRLYRKNHKDFRPKIIEKLAKNLEKPKSTLKDAFNKWRRLCEKEKNKSDLNYLKGKILKNNKNRVKERTKRDLLIKAFYKWKAETRKPEEYYPKINQGLNLLKKFAIKNNCFESFNKIKNSKNYQRRFKPILRNLKKNQKNNNKDLLRNYFYRWRGKVQNKSINDLKSNYIFNLKKNFDRNRKKNILSKYFTKWKIYRRKNLDYNFTKGLNLIQNFCVRPWVKDVESALQNKLEKFSKNKSVQSIFKKGVNNEKTILRKFLFRWWKNAALTDPNREKKISYKLKRMFNEKEKLPLRRALRIWQNQIKNVNYREKDIQKAKKMFANALRNNDKSNLNGAFSRWKKKIQQIRESYLKALLMKQIKNSQNVKKNVDNKRILHEAILRWRIRITPSNYLDRMKQIRKGCKLLKKGLKKPHEPKLFNGIRNNAIKNRRETLLKNVFKKTLPKMQEKNLRKLFNLWKSKIKDTGKMKNKLNDILNKFLISDSVHQKLFKNHKNDIINSLKNYNNIKHQKGKILGNFFKNIKNIQNRMNVMQRTILMKKIMNSRLNEMQNKKKIYLAKWNLHAQKIKNNENADIIQRFLKARLNKPAEKRRQIVNGAEILSKYTKKILFNKIFTFGKNNHMKKVLLKKFNNQENSNKNLKNLALKKWKNNVFNLKSNEFATKIQNLFRIHKAKNKLKSLKKLKEILIKLTNSKLNKNNSKIYTTFRKWQNRALILKNNENADIIQQFAKMKLMNLFKNRAKNKLKNLFRKNILHQLNQKMTKASRIIGDKGKVLYSTFEEIMLKRPFEKLIEKMRFLARIKALKKVQPKIHESLKKNFLPGALKKWKEKTWDEMIKKRIIIQKFMKKKYQIKKEKDKIRREKLLSKFVIKKTKNEELKLRIPFFNWNRKAKFESTNKSAIKIQNKFRQFKSKLLLNKIKALTNMQKLLKNNIKKKLGNSIKESANYSNELKKILQNLQSEFETRYQTNNLMNEVSNKIRVKNLEKILNKKSAFYLKSTANDFLSQLKKKQQMNLKFQKLKETLQKAQKEKEEKNKKILVQKIYKLNFFNKINKLSNAFNSAQKNQTKKFFAKDFLNRLFLNRLKHSQFSYTENQASTHQAPTTKFSFKSQSKKPSEKTDKLAPIKKVIPFFVKFLDNKITERKQQTLSKLKQNDLYSRFCNLYKNYALKKQIKPKKEIIKNLKEKSNYEDTKGEYISRLYSLIKKKYVNHITTSLENPHRMFKLIYLLRVLKLNKDVAKGRFLRELIRKWRFSAFVKKMARKKLELMYKNLHVSYLQMANEVFGDEDENNPSVIKEFERFGSNLGMFNSEDAQMNEEINKRYYSNVTKKYVFNSTVYEENKTEEKVVNDSKISSMEKIEDSSIKNEDFKVQNESSLNKTTEGQKLDMSIDWLAKYKSH